MLKNIWYVCLFDDSESVFPHGDLCASDKKYGLCEFSVFVSAALRGFSAM